MPDRQYIRHIEIECPACHRLITVGDRGVRLEPPLPRAVRSVEATPPPVLKPKERRIAVLLAQDQPNKCIAAREGIGERMVEIYRARIYRVLGVHGNAGVMRRLLQLGWVEAVEPGADAGRPGDPCSPPA
jgi:DNA-binding CsgD family transcriptional regulator